MLEKIIKRDRNEELEKILEKKNIDEQARNLLQGILYKVEVSYKDYKKIKSKKQTEEKYVKELLANIEKKCDKISIVKLSQKIENEIVQKELEKNKYYVGNEIISYPIEQKVLYAIEKKSRNEKILNNKYEEVTIALSDFINTGKNMDRVEVLRDFNGWSWTTINKELENIEANLIYQTLQIVLGEKFLENWCQDKDGIIDYLEQFIDETSKRYGQDIANQQKELLIKIAIASIANKNKVFQEQISEKIKQINKELEEFDNTEEIVVEITKKKKKLLKELNEVEKILAQETKLKEEFYKRNEEESIGKKIFNIKVLKLELINRKKDILEKIEEYNKKINPLNYLEKKERLLTKKEELQVAFLEQKELEKLLIEFIENILKCFNILIKKTSDEEKILNLIYKFRYFMLLPFNLKKKIKDVEKLKEIITDTESKLVQKAVQKQIIADAPFEVMKHIFETRIIILEGLYYKITATEGKHYVQIFDENVSEEKFEINIDEKIKKNKKVKIFI